MTLTRRSLLEGLAAVGITSLGAREARAFGEEGAFHARLLSTSKGDAQKEELSAARRWAWELTRRTSAPGRLASKVVSASEGELLEEPFAVWAGSDDVGKLSAQAVRKLRSYLRLGGMLVVDDRGLGKRLGAFQESTRRELRRVLPEAGVVKLPKTHVVFKSFYILEQPVGRRSGPGHVEAIVRGSTAQVLFLDHDLLGALARRGDSWARSMEVGGSEAREQAIRFAVNIAMYVLCSDYKDDQVHAPFLMRRRHRKR